MLRIKLPAVGPSNFINTSGATTHEKKNHRPKNSGNRDQTNDNEHF